MLAKVLQFCFHEEKKLVICWIAYQIKSHFTCYFVKKYGTLQSKFKTIDMQSLLLNSVHEMGEKVGYFSAWVLGLLFVAIWVWVMFRYLNTSDLK